MAPTESKTGRSIREGFHYQDHVALRLALELYIRREEFELFIEYRKKAKSFDDIVIVFSDRLEAYQAKHAADRNNLYTVADFTDPTDPREKRIYFEKFANSWTYIQKNFPTTPKKLYLYTNHALDAELFEVVESDGTFKRPFIKGTHRTEGSKKVRKALQAATKLNPSDFQEFLSCFHFQTKQLSLPELREYVQVNLIKDKLGFNNHSVYQDLKELIEDFSEHKSEALTSQHLDEIFKRVPSRYLLPQKFEVDRNLFVEQDELKTKLDRALEEIDGDYIVVTGMPGSGKSTSLTAYFDERERLSHDPIVRYYCFVDIHDNQQKRRLEAQSLRVNLLSELQDRFRTILSRQFDYTEEHFYEVLEILGEYFTSKHQKLILFIDGLDHAERMESEIHEHVLKTLPPHLPSGVVMIVGTQDLHNWPSFLKSSQENPATHIKLPLFTLPQIRQYLFEKHSLTTLSADQIQTISQRSEGLPLYLWYIAERLRKTEGIASVLADFPRITGGNIHIYHVRLWQEFETSGKGNIRHLCGILACLRFPVDREQFFEIQRDLCELPYPEFDDCLRLIRHLQKPGHNRFELFHNSFREFVLSQLDPPVLQRIYNNITTYLKLQIHSDYWFSYVFEYAYRAQDYAYLLDTINREFVDQALSHYRSDQEIENAISWAVESAKQTSDLLALSRLGSLKSRTNQRIKYLLNRDLLSRALLALGRDEDVIRYSYSLRHNRWLIDTPTALNILKVLPEHNRRELGTWLFSIFLEAFRDKRFENTGDVLNYAYCLGIYSTSLSHSLRWLARINWKPGIDEELQQYVPGYAPTLEMYVDAIVAYQPDACWRRLKKVKRLFSNQLIRYFLIRSVAHHKEKQVLRTEIEEYLSLFQPTSNPELAYYAALAGLQPNIVTQILGPVAIPPFEMPDQFYSKNPFFHTHRMIFIALGYEGRNVTLEHIRKHVSTKQSWWASYLLYLLYVGECVGKHWLGSQTDWFDSAIMAVNTLCSIRQSESDHQIWRLLEVCRAELEESLFWLTKIVQEQYPERLQAWFEHLKQLRDSKLWTTAYGIKEISQNYTFELKLYEKLSSLPRCRKYLIPMLEIFAKTYQESIMLKGGNRSEHFLLLSIIAAKCGYNSRAIEWLQYSITTTLIYGYHKDITLFQLIDIMEMVNEFDPDSALDRCVEIFEMIAWLPSLTDLDEVNALPEYIFKQIVKLHKKAALHLLQTHVQNHIHCLVEDCLQTFIKHVDSCEPEIFWAFTSIFTDPIASANVRQQIVKRLEQSGNIHQFAVFKQHLDHFIRTHVSLRHWSELNSDVWQIPDSVPLSVVSQSRQQVDSLRPETYTLHGKIVTVEEIKRLFHDSFESCKETFEQLKVENRGFFETELLDSALKFHITQATSIEDLIAIKEYINKWAKADIMQQLACQFIDSGDIRQGIECFEVAYFHTVEWPKWEHNRDYLRAIAEYDKRRIPALTSAEAYRSLIEYSGFEVPGLVANAYYVLKDAETLRKVYDDYVRYCQELFAQLPRQDRYSWLKAYSTEPDDWQPTAIHFLIDVLDTVDINAGYRLIDACHDLCLIRPSLVLPILVERLSETDVLIKSRILSILYMVSYHAPQLLLPYANSIAEYLEVKHFQWKMMLLKLFQNVRQQGTLSEQVQRKIEHTEFCYSSRVRSSTFRVLHTTPSYQFLKLFTERTLRTIQHQIAACCHLLNLDHEAVLAKIEQTLTFKGWTVEDASANLKSEWRDYVHVQGYPSIPILTTFEQKVLVIFNHLLDELIEKTGVDQEQIEALWRILQPVDPEYRLSSIQPRPQNIPPLLVSDKDQWLLELGDRQSEVTREPLTQEWLTIYEERVISQCEGYDNRYSQAIIIHSSLVKQGILPSEKILEDSWNVLKLVKFDDDEFVTLQQAREYLTNHQFLPTNELIIRSPSLPLVSMKSNSPLFFGYSNVLSLPRYLIEKYALTYKGFHLYAADECVVRYQVWQEGYEDDPYSRELLSHGTRLLIHQDLLTKMLHDYHVELYQGIFEKRLYFKSKYTPEPTEQTNQMKFIITHN